MTRLALFPFTPSHELRGLVQAMLSGESDLPLSSGLDAGIATGGGWVARVTAARGVTGLWFGADPWEWPRGNGSDPLWSPPGTVLHLYSGGWVRQLESGEVEVGLLPDLDAGLVLARIGAGSGEVEQALALLPNSEKVDRTLALLRPLAARLRMRCGRFPLPPPESEPQIAAALRALDDAPLSWPMPAPPVAIRLLRGLDTDGPLPLRRSESVEVALAALYWGRRELAREILEEVLQGGFSDQDDESPLPPLFLAARWLQWTGDGDPVLRQKPEVDQLVQALSQGADRLPPGAAFPSPARTLSLLGEAVEPLGVDGWNEALTGMARTLRVGPSDARRSLVLPVLGATPASEVHLPFPEEAQLPSPSAFAGPDTPGLLTGRSLHAARLLRSWVEGVLGARAEARYGRLTLAPRVPEQWARLCIPFLEVGDTQIRLDYREEGATRTFLLQPTGGRVPLNLVFEPWLPSQMEPEVALGGEVISVGVSEEDGGSRIRFQFPLDGEREVRIRLHD